MKLVNLTREVIRIERPGKGDLVISPDLRGPATVLWEALPLHKVQNIQIAKIVGIPQGIPPQKRGVVYIVAPAVAQAAWERGRLDVAHVGDEVPGYKGVFRDLVISPKYP